MVSDKEFLERFHFAVSYIKVFGLNEVDQLIPGEKTLYIFRKLGYILLKDRINYIFAVLSKILLIQLFQVNFLFISILLIS